MITVTFPIPRENIKAEMDKIRAEIDSRNAELRVLQTMFNSIRSLCVHEFPNRSHTGICIHCGYYVGSGDDR